MYSTVLYVLKTHKRSLEQAAGWKMERGELQR